MKNTLIAYVVFAIYKLLYWTWRIEIHHSPKVEQWLKEKKPFAIAHWHGDELGVIHLIKPYHVAVIVSTSTDGEIMNQAVKLFGGEAARGSSTRGGSAALKGILKLVKKGRRPGIAVDGPKGPIYKVKPGVMQISRLAKIPIVPLAFQADRVKIFEKSWNKSKLPKPFAKLVIVYGEPMDAITKDQDPKDLELAKALEQRINEASKQALAKL